MIQQGDFVSITDHAPEPPARHTRKHARWRMNNFTGWVHRVERNGGLAVDETGRGVGTLLVRPWELTVTKANPDK